MGRGLFSCVALAAFWYASYPIGVLPAAAQTTTAEPQNIAELVAAVKREGGTLNVSWSQAVYGGVAGAQRLQDGINRKYNVDLKINYTPLAMPGVAYVNQVVQEVKAGHASSSDLIFAVTSSEQAAGMRADDYRPFEPDVPGTALYYDNRAVAVATIASGFVYNTKEIPPDKVPTSLEDLLAPQWKGKISTPPYEGVEGGFLGLPQAMGHDGMIKFFTAFSKQLGGVVSCGQSQRVASSEFLMFGIDCGDTESRLLSRQGLPLAEIYPKEGVGISYYAVGIPRTSAHPNAALLLTAYLVSPEGQSVLWDVMAIDNWKLPGSHLAPILKALSDKGGKLIEYYGTDVTHPELNDYAREINALVNAPR